MLRTTFDCASHWPRLPPAGLIGLAVPALLGAQTAASPVSPADTAPRITIGGFVDGYYAYDFNRPANFDRAFTTQPARHNEFNVNLAFIEARLEGPRIRGRLALQTGTSVQANYAGEPRNGSVSGPDLARLIQEAVVGIKAGDHLWVDGGIFLSHIGLEGFISRDNLLYTRSLVADFSPYYESGAKVTWQATPTIAAQLDVVNGWQIISESNSAKSAGVRIDYVPSPTTTVSYFNYFGNEAPDTAMNARYRFYNGVGAKMGITTQLQLLVELDYGRQRRASRPGHSTWYGGMIAGRYQVGSSAAIVGRVERYADSDQVIVVTGVPDGFRANGASVGLDITPQPRVLWRTELRAYQAEHAVFPQYTGGRSRHDSFLVTSLALTL